MVDTFDVLRRGKERQDAQNNANYNQGNGQGYNQAPNQGYNNQGYQQPSNNIPMQQNNCILHGWIEKLGLDTSLYSTHSMRRTKPYLILQED